MKKYTGLLYSSTLLAIFSLLFVTCSNHTTDQSGKWIKADFHMHTTMSDGSNTPGELAENAFKKYDLDLIALSEHGGRWFKVNNEFSRIDDNNNVLLDGKDYELMKNAEMKKYKNQSRTIQLENKSFNEVLRLRKTFPEKLIIQGLEWNIPGHGHGSVGILAETGKDISNFHYIFDRGDADYLAQPRLEKYNKSVHENSLKGIKYLHENYPEESYFIVNHPSRSLKYSVSDLRDFNNAAPNIAIGFEGIPGHQKFEGNRCEYTKALSADSNYDSRTYGGADHFLSKIGGVWDAMLGEGRKYWVLGNSDYHAVKKDYWPGEYTTNYIWSEENSYNSVISGMKSGNIFVVQNNLIVDLEFSAYKAEERKTMGESLSLKKGEQVKIIIGYTSKSSSDIEVDHIDLISGDLNGLIKPDSTEYNTPINKTTKILKSFNRSDFLKNENGMNFTEFTFNAEKSEYYRLRGSSLSPNTINETDEFGNPLCDTLVVNNDELAKSDSWFYSNPIFINVMD